VMTSGFPVARAQQTSSNNRRIQLLVFVVVLLVAFTLLNDVWSESMIAATAQRGSVNKPRKHTTTTAQTPQVTISPAERDAAIPFAKLHVYDRNWTAAELRAVPAHAALSTIIITLDCSVYSDWQSVIAIGSLRRLRLAYPESQRFRIVKLVACNAGTAGISKDVEVQ
jgi:hypothetical protein